jgi:hypothetical protein
MMDEVQNPSNSEDNDAWLFPVNTLLGRRLNEMSCQSQSKQKA